MVLVQKWPFIQLYFLGNIGPENIFEDILERKKSKNLHFSKAFNPWFWSKNGRFSNFFFLGNKRKKNVFYDILERKNVFVEYKNKKFKKTKK